MITYRASWERRTKCNMNNLLMPEMTWITSISSWYLTNIFSWNVTAFEVLEGFETWRRSCRPTIWKSQEKRSDGTDFAVRSKAKLCVTRWVTIIVFVKKLGFTILSSFKEDKVKNDFYEQLKKRNLWTIDKHSLHTTTNRKNMRLISMRFGAIRNDQNILSWFCQSIMCSRTLVYACSEV